MLLRFVQCCLLAGLGSHVSWASAEEKINVREGLWRIDVEMIIPGKGPENPGPIFRDMCLNTSNFVGLVLPVTPMCNGRITHQESRRLDLQMTCSQGQTVSSSKGTFEFAGEKLVGAVLSSTPRYGMEIKTIIRGKYLGACPAAMARSLPPAVPRSAPGPAAAPPLRPYSP